MVRVNFLKLDVAIEQLIHHMELQVFLDLEKRVLVFGLAIDDTHHEVLVRLVDQTES